MKLLNKKNSISDFLRKLRNPSLLILDYDGTLAPFNKIREAAFPYEGVVERLHQLLNLKNTRVVVVSGRSIQDMYHLLPSGLELWGSYGFQKRSAEGKEENMPLDQTCREGLQLAQNLCQNVVSDEHLELKPYSLAVHWRGAEQSKEMLKSVGALWETLCPTHNLEVHAFDGGLELRPKNRGKSDVVQQLLQESSNDTPVAYLGDDLSDEEAFKTLGDRALKVLVREQWRPTLADVHLIPPDELLKFLDQWIFYTLKSAHV